MHTNTQKYMLNILANARADLFYPSTSKDQVAVAKYCLQWLLKRRSEVNDIYLALSND